MEWVAGLLFVSVILVLLAGFPVAFSLGGTALLFALFGVIGGSFNEALPPVEKYPGRFHWQSFAGCQCHSRKAPSNDE